MHKADLWGPRSGERRSWGDWLWVIGWLLILAWGPVVAVMAAGFPVPLWFTVLGWSLVPTSIGLMYWSIRMADREDVHGETARPGADDGAATT